ncbi:MAG: DUF790 family protein [Lentisphaeria bacterium]|nr:DUF790 family protein [Lentisphaeria bacterium]
MLTKDLIRCRCKGERLYPRFVPVDDAALLGLAERLLGVFRAQPPPTRGELLEAGAAVLGTERDAPLAKGLCKLLLDRCEFRQPGEGDYAAWRAAVFGRSAEALREGGLEAEAEDFRGRILAALVPPSGLGAEDLYGDLPENEVLERFRDLGPKQLLERYNVGLVQALLLRAEDLTLTVPDPEAAPMRRLLKYLRFFRLLARVFGQAPDAGGGATADACLRVVIDGPGSILAHSARYGLQLASFFPAVCALRRWSLETRVAWKGDHRLVLTEASGLVCHYRNFSAYVPEEVSLFHRHFRQTVTDWRIVGHTPFLSMGGQELVFPDLSFEGSDGTCLHLELFHRWHAGPLLQRLRALDAQPALPLVIGVDRSLTRDAAIADALEASPCFARRGFLFRDYPTVERAVACLRQAAARGRAGNGDPT